MVTTIITNEEGQEICRQVNADEGKLIYNKSDLAELGENAIGQAEMLIPLEWDVEEIYTEI